MGLNSRQGGGGDLPSLDLAFALDRSFTTDPADAGKALITSRRGPAAKFSRGSGATQVNAAGLIEYAPENLITRSEEFDDASWSKSQVTVNQNATTSPSRIINADKVVESTATSIHRIVKGSLSAIAGTIYSVSVYAKADGRRYLYLNAGGFGSNSTFDLESGVVSATQNGTASITNAGNGWWRCTTMGTAATTQTTVVNFQLNNTSSASDSSYTGDGTSGLYLWGAQLERASTARTYYPTTTSVFYGPRFDHDPATGDCKGLLIEEPRTNLLSRSEEFDSSAWDASGGRNLIVTANDTASPSGVTDADKLTVGVGVAVYQVIQSLAAVTSGVAYTVSLYVKPDQVTKVRLWMGTLATLPIDTYFDLAGSGSVISAYAGSAASITQVANGWYRIQVTATAGASASTSLRFGPSAGSGATVIGNGVDSFFAWGAQLEAGAFPTSYIPTTSGTLQRSADVCSIIGTDFSSFYNQSEGSMFADATPQTVDQLSVVVGVNTATFQNSHLLYKINATALAAGKRWVANTNVAGPAQSSLIPTPTDIAVSRGILSYAYKLNDMAFAANGTLIGTDNAGTMPFPTAMRIGGRDDGLQLNGHIARIQYFRKRLPNAKLQTLTAP